MIRASCSALVRVVVRANRKLRADAKVPHRSFLFHRRYCADFARGALPETTGERRRSAFHNQEKFRVRHRAQSFY